MAALKSIYSTLMGTFGLMEKNENGEWGMGNGEWGMGKQQMTNNKGQTTNNKQQITNDKLRRE